LRGYFEKSLSLEDVQALAPDLLAAVKTRCPADTMFGNEIRMGAYKALTKYHFKEAIASGVDFAKTQGGHGSQKRTGEIVKELVAYGSAAKEAAAPICAGVSRGQETTVECQSPVARKRSCRRQHAASAAVETQNFYLHWL
jgi:hypothetical protein